MTPRTSAARTGGTSVRRRASRPYRASQLPAIIIMDLDMPVMDGWAATRILKADARAKHVPIIVVTCNVMPDHVQAARDAGADAVLKKPCAPGALAVAIEHALRGEPVPTDLCSH